MNSFRSLANWLVAGACSCWLTTANAEPPAFTDMSEMVRRLEAAEQRIRDLETRRLPAVEVSHSSNNTWYQDEEEDWLADRVETLEKELEKQKDKEAKAKSDAKKKPSQVWSGRIHADYWAFPGFDDGSNTLERGDPTLDIQDRFLFRRLRFGVSGKLFDTMQYKVEMDFASPIGIAFKDAYLGWNELPIFQTLLLGNQKRPYGLDHLNSSRYNVFMERPFSIEAYNQDARRFGLASYGISEDERYNWRFGTYLLRDTSKTGFYLATDDPGLHDYQAEFAGRFANTIWYDEISGGRGYAHWAVSGTVAFPDGTAGSGNDARFRTRPESRSTRRWINTGRIVDADRYELVGFEGVINTGPVQWVGELQHNWLQRSSGGGPEVQTYGGYMYVAWFLTGEHIPWSRTRGTIGRVKPFENFFLVNRCRGGHGHGLGAWQIAARYSYADFNDSDIFGGVGKSFTFGLNWHWTPYSRMQFNYIIGDIEDREDGDSLVNANYNILGARFMVDF